MYFILHTLLAFALEPDQVIFNKAATEMNNSNPDGCMKILSTEGREYLYLKKMKHLDIYKRSSPAISMQPI